MVLNLGKHKKLWNKGFDGIVVMYSHESRVGVFRIHNLDTGKTHNTRNVRGTGKLHKDCVKEDAVSEEDSSMSDSTRNEKREEDEVKTEKESLDGMVEVTEVVDSEQLIMDQKVRKVRTLQLRLTCLKKWESELEGREKRWERT